MKTYISIVSLAVMLVLFTACTKLVQIPAPADRIVTTTVFADSTDAVAAVSGIYNNAWSSPNQFRFSNGAVTVFTGLAADELNLNGGNNYSAEITFYTNTIIPTAQDVSGLDNIWSQAYFSIYQANACIEGITTSTGLSISLKNQLLGESKLFRAFFYFNLVNLFGGVPLVTSTDYHVNQLLPRSSVDQIYRQITSDLIDAQNLLSDSYPISNTKGRPNKYAASALLARVYLYQKQWSNAEAIASAIINSGKYSLQNNLNDVFLTNSNEAIWQIPPPVQGNETTEGNMFVTLNGVIPPYSISNYLLSAFEANDQRKVNWLKMNSIGSSNFYFPFKYKVQNDGSNPAKENYMIFRLAEIYLIRAEARAQLGIDLISAASDLNIVRSRAGLGTTGATTQSTLITAIYHERQVELFCEWGHRWYDLKRTGQIDAVLGGATGVCASKGGSWNTNWALFPIPFVEIQLNTALTQNPGY